MVAAAFALTAVVPTSARAQAATGKKAAKPAAAAAGASVEEELIKIEKERAAAAVKADTALLEKYTAADYTFINRSGQLSDRTQTMSRLKSGDIKITANDVSDLKVRLYGNTAVVTGRTDMKGTMAGKDVSGPVLFTRVYVKTDGRWQAVAFQQTPVAP
jgi:ketosteroid isomerase-like protein